MAKSMRGPWSRTLAIGATWLLLAMTAATAQVPTAEQMEMFRNLPPDQQQAILEAMGGGGLSGGGSSGVRRDRDLDSPETVRPRDPYDDADGDRTDSRQGFPYGTSTMPREPRIRGMDTVLLDLAIEEPGAQTPEPVAPPAGAFPGTGTVDTSRTPRPPTRLDRVTAPITADQRAQLESTRLRILVWVHGPLRR